MVENKRLIHGSYGEQRYLHSDEIFCKERNWNINLPSEREFKNEYCIITDKDNTAYSIDELVKLLNEFQKENEQLKQYNQQITEVLEDGGVILTKNQLKSLVEMKNEDSVEVRHLKTANAKLKDEIRALREYIQKKELKE